MFIVDIDYIRPLEEVDTCLQDHITWLKQQYKAGYFIASGRKTPRTGGVILSDMNKREDLEMVMAGDPFSKKGISKYTITEFIPSMHRNDFPV